MFMGVNEVYTTAKHEKENHNRGNQDRKTDRNTHTPHTHTHTHTHTHLTGGSVTYWTHLGGFHNLRDTVATHTQVRTRQKQM